MPRFERVDLGGGVIANAIALPSVTRPAVLFTDTVLERLTQDEAAAICAHELAHLEYYNPTRVRRLNLETSGLIVGAVVFALLPRTGLTDSLLSSVVWSCVLLVALVWRVRDRQRLETESDVRAVALTGDPEALVRGLSKLYACARIPRRFDSQQEQQATHPSLARRIRAIRVAGGVPPPSLSTGTSFLGLDSRTQVVFGDERVEWREGEAAVHALSYGHLAELRLHARGWAARSSSRSNAPVGAGKWRSGTVTSLARRRFSTSSTAACRISPRPRASGQESAECSRPWLPRWRSERANSLRRSLRWRRWLPRLTTAWRRRALHARRCSAFATRGCLVTPRLGPVADDHARTLGLFLTKASLAPSDHCQLPVRRVLMVLALLAVLAIAMVLSQGFNALALHRGARALPAAVILPMALAGALAPGGPAPRASR
jgi:hypothetical protein